MKNPWGRLCGLCVTPLIVFILLSACMPRLPAEGKVKGSKTYRVTTNIRTGDFKRDFLIHIPPGYSGRKKLPMLVVIHGAFDTAEGIEEIAGFSEIADRENFIVLYPNGIGILGFLQHWNAGHCCGKAQADEIDDVGFVAAAIESAGKRVNVDPARIFMVGFSNGGMFTYRFASEKSHMLAGAAALAASIGSKTPEDEKTWNIPRPTHPVPFLVIHGTADKSVPFEGKTSQRKGTPRFYQSVEASVGFWKSQNGCRDALPPQQLLDGGAAQLTKWSDCTSGNPVWLITLKDWEHIWPGPYFTAKLPGKDPFKDFDAAEIIWDFFSHLNSN